MKLLQFIILSVLTIGCLASVSNINLGPTGYYPKVSTTSGLTISVIILTILILGEIGVVPFEYTGRKRRSIADSAELFNSSLIRDEKAVLQVVFFIHSSKKMHKYTYIITVHLCFS